MIRERGDIQSEVLYPYADTIACPVLREIALAIVHKIRSGKWRIPSNPVFVVFDACHQAHPGHTAERIQWLQDRTNKRIEETIQGKISRGIASLRDARDHLRRGFGFGLYVIVPKQDALKVLADLCTIDAPAEVAT